MIERVEERFALKPDHVAGDVASRSLIFTSPLGFTGSATSRPAQTNHNGRSLPQQGAPDRYGTL
jgi:hypothetical protein